MEALIHIITGLGVFMVAGVIFAESGLFFGFFLPGDSLIFVSGSLVQQGIFNINIHLFVILLAIAAIVGDSTGYAFGHKVGRKLFMKDDNKIFKRKYLIDAETFFEKHGPIAIILARFVPIVRTFTPIVAGASKMNYSKFIIYNILGGASWVACFSYLGYYLGKALTEMGVNIEIMAIIIVLLSVLPMFISVLTTKERRQKIINKAKNILSKDDKKPKK